MTPARDNPFRVDRLHALAFEPQGMTWAAMLQRLHRLRCRAAIVGPHGSGKTTLLEALASHFQASGKQPRLLFRNAEDGRGIPPAWLETLETLTPRDVLLVDGYSHLGIKQRRQLRSAARHVSGLIVTAHHRCRLPTLIRTRTDPALLGRLVTQLTGQTLPADTLVDLHRRHRGNLREALRELYDTASPTRSLPANQAVRAGSEARIVAAPSPALSSSSSWIDSPASISTS